MIWCPVFPFTFNTFLKDLTNAFGSTEQLTPYLAVSFFVLCYRRLYSKQVVTVISVSILDVFHRFLVFQLN